jgi:hypothetical protein
MRWIPSLCLMLLITGAWTPLGADDDGRTIWGDDLRSTLKAMKKVQRSLGVKSCLHCHVKQDGKVKYEIETEHKEIARSMYYAFVDTLANTGKARLEVGHDSTSVLISAVRKLKGEDAGIHLRVVLPAKNKGKEPTTLSRRIDLPGKDQPIECGTCHGGKLHFLTQE